MLPYYRSRFWRLGLYSMGTMYFGQPEYVDVCLPLVNEAHKVSKHTSVLYYNPLFMCISVYLRFHWCQIYTLAQF